MNLIHQPTSAHNLQFLTHQVPLVPPIQQQALQPSSINNARRVLRPRTEPRSYVESPEVLINGSLDSCRPRTNGNISDYSSADSCDGEMQPLPPIKELSPAEIKQRYFHLHFFRSRILKENNWKNFWCKTRSTNTFIQRFTTWHLFWRMLESY